MEGNNDTKNFSEMAKIGLLIIESVNRLISTFVIEIGNMIIGSDYTKNNLHNKTGGPGRRRTREYVSHIFNVQEMI